MLFTLGEENENIEKDKERYDMLYFVVVIYIYNTNATCIHAEYETLFLAKISSQKGCDLLYLNYIPLKGSGK